MGNIPAAGASPNTRDTNMLVFFALGNAKVLSFALGDAEVPNANGFASQWNIGFSKTLTRLLRCSPSKSAQMPPHFEKINWNSPVTYRFLIATVEIKRRFVIRIYLYSYNWRISYSFDTKAFDEGKSLLSLVISNCDLMHSLCGPPDFVLYLIWIDG